MKENETKDLIINEEEKKKKSTSFLKKVVNILPNGNVVLLYIFYLIMQWGYRMYQFFIPIMFSKIFPHSLFPFSIFQITNLLISFILGSNVGNVIDHFNRLSIAGVMIFIQNLSIAVCSVGLYWLYYFETKDPIHAKSPYWPFNKRYWNGFMTFLIMIGCTLVNSVFQLAQIGTNVIIRKDWTLVLSKSYTSNLELMNAVCYGIDMICNALSPLSLSFLLNYYPLYALYVVGGYNLAIYIVEMILLTIIYCLTPQMKEKEKMEKELNPIYIVTYITQDVLFASIPYVLLFFSVMSPDDILLTYLSFSNVDERIIGTFKAVASGFGYFASILTPILINVFGLVRAGLFSYLIQSTALLFGTVCYVAGYLIFDDGVALYILMGGVAVSRMGLWGVDQSQTQIMQCGIPAELRGIVNSVEQSLTNFVNMTMFMLSIAAADPRYFIIMIGSSMACIMISYVIFFAWAYSRKGQKINIVDKQIRKNNVKSILK